ncbi:MAG: polysaccharide deacetylase family protein, partial [Candidatus Eremiobacteraeota bacterium]|nr:polysaccharide deacetylase family protein [Candidatus Eremiobacteraeota bacterium]
MKPGLRLAAIVAALVVVVAYVGYRIVHRAFEAPIPAVVLRGANASALVSQSLRARLDRYFNDRYAPVDERGSNAKLVALSFDDGPYPVETPLLLDELSELHVPATFFLIGDDTEMFPQLAQRIEADGNE